MAALLGSAAVSAAAPERVIVWRVGSLTNPDAVPPTGLPLSFRKSAERAGFSVAERGVPGRGFIRRFRDAGSSGEGPDLLVFTNMSVIIGLPAVRNGGFGAPGLEDDPAVRASLVDVSEWFREFSPGWAYAIRTSGHFSVIEALATADPCGAASSRRSIASGVEPVFAEIATRGASAHLTNDAAALDQLSGGHYPADTLPLGRASTVLERDLRKGETPRRSARNAVACAAWGNSRVAVIDVGVTFTGDLDAGRRQYVAVVARAEGIPRLVSLADSSNNVVEDLVKRAPQLSPDPGGSVPSPPVLVKPAPRAAVTRIPPEARPKLVWNRPTELRPYVYLLEFQRGPAGELNPSRWDTDSITLANVDRRGTRAVVSVQMPFGAGRQPHRWRVWAIDDHGRVARSEWRLLFFRN